MIHKNSSCGLSHLYKNIYRTLNMLQGIGRVRVRVRVRDWVFRANPSKMVLSILSTQAADMFTQVPGHGQTHWLFAPSAQHCHCTHLIVATATQGRVTSPFHSSLFLRTQIFRVGWTLKASIVAKCDLNWNKALSSLLTTTAVPLLSGMAGCCHTVIIWHHGVCNNQHMQRVVSLMYR